MIKSPIDSFNLNTDTLQLLNDLLGNLRASTVRIIVFVVVFREAVKIIDQIRFLGNVDGNPIWAILPVSRTDNHSFELDFGGDLLPNFDKFCIGRMLGVLHEVGPANAEEVDRCP